MKVTALVVVKKYTSDIKNGCFKPTNDKFYSVALPPHRTSGLLFLESSSQLLHCNHQTHRVIQLGDTITSFVSLLPP